MKIAIIGEYNESFRPHLATNEAIEHSRRFVDTEFSTHWISTELIEYNLEKIIETYHGFWIAPGSPYKSMEGALELIKQTRIRKIPTIGTCGGFQHMVLEYSRNVLKIEGAEHAEYMPYASKLIIKPLSCNLKGEPLEIQIIDKNSRTYSIYELDQVMEKYYCDFGLNPEYQQEIHLNGFRIVGSDNLEEARIMELENHPFYIATLFVPQDNSTADNPHKLVLAFLKAAWNHSLGDIE